MELCNEKGEKLIVQAHDNAQVDDVAVPQSSILWRGWSNTKYLLMPTENFLLEQ